MTKKKKKITIKFSHEYLKMPPDTEQTLLVGVFPVKLEELSRAFVIYDTAYNDIATGQVAYYPLPEKGDYMVLLLLSAVGFHLWTTIRSQIGEHGRDKLAYYRDHVGEPVNIEILEGAGI